ncbi:putative orfan [Tupanvirus soda lake]|uniref:Orfan n=2 Tax=Tupanvirus TaxID=2094720 RepID=A0AC62AB39_9VIRU|nr:putative orfan [Tupanvirus soda lake]QKU34873.1 putative orfan [Tupanvirus soda lake]
METLPETLESSNQKLTFGIENKMPDIISQAIKTEIPEKLVNSMLESVDPGTEQFKYLMALKIMQMSKSCTPKNYQDLKLYIGYRFYFFFDLKIDDTNANATILETDFDSEKFKMYCDDIMKLLWPEKQTEDLEYVVLQLGNYFLTLENLFAVHPHLKQNTLTLFKLLCSIHEIIHIYYALLKEYYQIEGITKNINFPTSLSWIFDNQENPIEKTLNANIGELVLMQDNEMRNYADITIEQFHGFIKKTYDFKKIFDSIRTFYFADELMNIIKTLDSSNNYPVNKEQIISFLLYDFIINHDISDFLLKNE